MTTTMHNLLGVVEQGEARWFRRSDTSVISTLAAPFVFWQLQIGERNFCKVSVCLGDKVYCYVKPFASLLY